MRRLVLAALLLLAPLAAAQTQFNQAHISVGVNDPARALLPGANETIEVVLNYYTPAGVLPAPGDDPTRPENTSAPTKVRLAVKQMPSWVLAAAFESEVVDMPPPPPGQTNSARMVLLTLAIDPRAPALQREEIIVTATADPNGAISGATGESPGVKLRAAHVAKLNVTAEESVLVKGGRWTVLPFTVKNLGNAEQKVRLNVTARPQESEVRFPDSLTLPRDGEAVVEVELRIPWTKAQGGIVELEALPLTELDDGRPAKADVEILGQSAVPGAGALGLLAACLLAARRRSAR